jgi:hypothetical protein
VTAGAPLVINSQKFSLHNKPTYGSLPEKPPVTGFVSQIREGEYSLANGLAGFLLPPAPDDGLWPLQFTVQLTVNDSQRWEFFSKDGVRTVVDGIRKHGQWAQLQELRQLCLLQRVFRAALAGSFGAEFPVERLAQLQAETQPTSKASVATPNWLAESGNADPVYAGSFKTELAVFLKDAESMPKDGVTQAEIPKIKGCQAALGGSPQDIHRKCVWDFAEDMRLACVSEWDGKSEDQLKRIPSCRIFDLSYLGQIVDSLYGLQTALGAVTKDTKASELGCAKAPPPVQSGAFAMAVR